jgi:hypothetical protein
VTVSRTLANPGGFLADGRASGVLARPHRLLSGELPLPLVHSRRQGPGLQRRCRQEIVVIDSLS